VVLKLFQEGVMNTCQCCGKRKIGGKPYCFSCDNKIRNGLTEEDMKRKISEDVRYCQYCFCPNRGKEFDAKEMVKVKDMFFCSDPCKKGFMKKNFINETDA